MLPGLPTSDDAEEAFRYEEVKKSLPPPTLPAGPALWPLPDARPPDEAEEEADPEPAGPGPPPEGLSDQEERWYERCLQEDRVHHSDKSMHSRQVLIVITRRTAWGRS